jgi:hypothetical protein
MIPINVSNSPTASRIKLVVTCNHCGHKSTETLSRFHGRYMVVCRECASVVDLKAKENRIFLEKLAQVVAEIDAALGDGKKGL